MKRKREALLMEVIALMKTSLESYDKIWCDTVSGTKKQELFDKISYNRGKAMGLLGQAEGLDEGTGV